MTVEELEIERTAGGFGRPSAGNLWTRVAFRKLNRVFEESEAIRIDDRSRFVFFSDCHRGDNGKSDAFKHNKEITMQAMERYYRQGFTYVEVGDGDDLWQVPSFRKIQSAHRCVFEQIRKFRDSGRLYMVLGNHEIRRGQKHLVRKGDMSVPEGLVLKHVETGKSIFVVHGHQADLFSGVITPVSRIVVRTIVKNLHAAGLVEHRKEISSLMNSRPGQVLLSKLEKPLVAWAGAYRRILICGHTHRAAYPRPGDPPYFNTGSCVYPGFITALELVGGKFRLVKWLSVDGEALRVPMSATIPISALG